MNKLKLKTMLEEFFEEDLGFGDLTSESIFTEQDFGYGVFVAKDDGIFCGVDVIKQGFTLLNERISIDFHLNDGAEVIKGDKIATVEGPVIHLLTGERVILNLIQRMSGIATITNKAVVNANSNHTKICDTRKTTPGLRMLEKYAVTCGGGYNHRFGLYDAVMIKDNHIAASGGIEEAVKKVREKLGHTVKIEVETESKEDVIEAVKAKADIIMFDNRTPEEIIQFKELVPDGIITEASGGITLDNVASYAFTEVDYISLGFLTHSAKALDISFNVEV
ncbi:carboxylating nicotinate-nucleotide diphosphorylase [Anaerobacillus isosaccharinicus]|uniref:Probable nicotinate-nucleotide pyrophosphorylase [carboxylating] n=1 Tax=Anaerobacillus isosaccharinicus TaxID=1532552 RepID=A0A1S2KTV4_9BACI|nr:carboxylating nicotinate-nucleotide diphosphorylase [Anaerobacillus isosaccharinicus]MBA5585344.1 carboxylating nicotinate-nucleotide diphosphorylase [Anaerobacillus isosaccharinicus]QOY36332.1 carboxylating nicotinate-nucleotide diphosphorylase [Anaerobacillus isosaccharinicus]